MRSMALMLTFGCVLIACTAAAGEPEPAMTTGNLQQLCLGEDHVSKNACRVYILGVTQGIAVGLAIAARKAGARPCVPAEVSAEALEQRIKAELGADLSAHPADRDHDASGFIGTVLNDTFPCAQGAAASLK